MIDCAGRRRRILRAGATAVVVGNVAVARNIVERAVPCVVAAAAAAVDDAVAAGGGTGAPMPVALRRVGLPHRQSARRD